MKTSKEKIISLLQRNAIENFEDVFVLYNYPKKEVYTAVRITPARLNNIIRYPSKMKYEEIKRISQYFQIKQSEFLTLTLKNWQ